MTQRVSRAIVAAPSVAPPRRPPLVSPLDTMDEAGRRVLRLHLDRMIQCEPGTREGKDIEAVHDMRVATRRLRVACRVFGKALGKNALAPFRDALRRVGVALGAVRDFDVFIESVETFRREHGGSGQDGFDMLLAHLRQERGLRRARLIRLLNSARYTGLTRRFPLWLDGAGNGLGPRTNAGQRSVRKAAPHLLDCRLSRVIAYRKRLDEEASPETLHALRIACKRLRYTAEFFRDCYDGRLDGLIDRMVELQDILGRFNDAGVRVAYLTGYAGRLDRRSPRARRTERAAQRLIEAERQAQQDSLMQFWDIWEEVGVGLQGLHFEL